MKTFHDFSDDELKDLIKMRLHNEKFETNTVKIKGIIIDERRLFSVVYHVISNYNQQEKMIFAAFKKCYADEFLLLQKMDLDFQFALTFKQPN